MCDSSEGDRVQLMVRINPRTNYKPVMKCASERKKNKA